MFDSLPAFLVITATFLAAGVVKGTIGLGLPVVAMGVLGSFMTPVQAAALLLVPSFVTNVWQLLVGPSLKRLLVRLRGMLAAIVVGAWAGSGLIAGDDARPAAVGLGLALLVYGLIGLGQVRFRLAPRHERWAAPVVGLATGLVTGATGVFAIPAVPYLTALDLDRDDMIQALGLSFTASTVALAAGLAWRGALPSGALAPSFVALVPALVGMALGNALRSRIEPALFRRLFFAGLVLLGGEIAARAALG